MKHNRIWFLPLLVMSIVALTGCMGVQDLDDEQTALIAEYSAGILLRYSETYEKRLIVDPQKEAKDSGEESTPTPLPTPTQDSSSGSAVAAQETGKPANASSSALNDLYNVPGVDFSYKSYKFCDVYPKKSSTMQITAKDGETLLVVSFQVKNTSGKKKKVKLLKRAISYRLDIDGSEFQPGINILPNGGLNYLSTDIGKGKSEKAVLIFNVAKDRKKAAKMTLTIQDGGKTANVRLK